MVIPLGIYSIPSAGKGQDDDEAVAVAALRGQIPQAVLGHVRLGGRGLVQGLVQRRSHRRAAGQCGADNQHPEPFEAGIARNRMADAQAGHDPNGGSVGELRFTMQPA